MNIELKAGVPRAESNLGEQPIKKLLEIHGLKHHDVVTASEVGMTHKMLTRAEKGRRLTDNTKRIVLNALNRATGSDYTMSDLFDY